MRNRNFSMVAALISSIGCGSANADLVDLGKVWVEFDGRSFGSSYLVDGNSISFFPALSLFVPYTGGSESANFSAQFRFTAKPGLSISGYQVVAAGDRSEPEYTDVAATGTVTAGSSSGQFSSEVWANEWFDVVNLGPGAVVNVQGRLSATSTPQIWSTWEQTGTESVLVRQDETQFYNYEYVEDRPVYAEEPYVVIIDYDDEGNAIYEERCCETVFLGFEPFYDWVLHTNVVDIYEDRPVYSEVFHQTGNSALISLNSLSITAHVVPVPAALPLMSFGLAALGWSARKRRVATQKS